MLSQVLSENFLVLKPYARPKIFEGFMQRRRNCRVAIATACRVTTGIAAIAKLFKTVWVET